MQWWVIALLVLLTKIVVLLLTAVIMFGSLCQKRPDSSQNGNLPEDGHGLYSRRHGYILNSSSHDQRIAQVKTFIHAIKFEHSDSKQQVEDHEMCAICLKNF